VTTLNATNTTQARTYLTDALGSVIAQTQDNQSTLAGYSYSPYGQTQSTGNTEGDSVQYTGRENDNNGLYYYRARYYDPVLKRFLSEDPIGLAGGSLSFYSYVNGNPVSYTDPEGLQKTMPRPVVPVIPGPRNGSQQDADNGGDFGRSRDGGRSRARVQRDGGGNTGSCDDDCKPPVGTRCYEGPDTTHSHGGLGTHYHIYQMFKFDGECQWKYLGGKVGKGVLAMPPAGMSACSSYPGFQGR
jgi:RHS repeat-associated protein